MYCIKCGVKLADTEKSCPLCGTVVFHPELFQGEGKPLYPRQKQQIRKNSGYLLQFLLSFCVFLAMIIVFVCDLQISKSITWSGYVLGGLGLGYICVILPMWFKRPNPVIFLSADFVAAGGYLLLVNLLTGGKWFLSFAFPVTGGVGIIIVTVVALVKYLKKGKMFVFGGMLIALGLFMMLVEFLISITFKVGHFLLWSLYPLVVLSLVGIFLIFLGTYRPAREMMEKKFFI